MVKYIATKREGDVIVANFEEQKVNGKNTNKQTRRSSIV